MSLIPKHIKDVSRPKSTQVRSFGNQFYVYPYTSIYDPISKKPKRKTLPYIGKIVFDENTSKWIFVERETQTLTDTSEIKTYGDVKFIDDLCSDIHNELINYYGVNDGTKIYVYSILRLLYGDTNSYLDDAYYSSYLSEMYPKVAISKNSILEFIQKLGKHENTNKNFLISRTNKDHQILIFDGTQITNESTSNANTEFGRGAKKTNKTQMCEIKVYDTISKEPIYYEVIPGNVIDKTAFISVLEHFDVKKAIIIVDKGFNTSENIKYLKDNNINFIVPYNDNSKIIKTVINTHNYTQAFNWEDKSIKAMKAIIDDNLYYLFQDPYIKATQEANYIKQIDKNKKGYTIESLNEKEKTFGVICFQTNIDTDDFSLIYTYYKERWEIEVNVKLEKNTLDNEVVRVHGTIGALGIRFLIQLEMIMISRIYFKLKELEILKSMSIRTVLTLLNRSYMSYRNGKWKISIMTKKKQALLTKLGVPVK